MSSYGVEALVKEGMGRDELKFVGPDRELRGWTNDPWERMTPLTGMLVTGARGGVEASREVGAEGDEVEEEGRRLKDEEEEGVED